MNSGNATRLTGPSVATGIGSLTGTSTPRMSHRDQNAATNTSAPAVDGAIRGSSISLENLFTATRGSEPSTPGFILPGAEKTTMDQPAGDMAIAANTVATLITREQSLRYPFRCIGQVQWLTPKRRWRAAGTGTLVGPWHLLTASHGINPGGRQFRFVPAYWGYTRESQIKLRWYDAEIIGHIGIDIDHIEGFDYVVCELDKPLGLDWGWLGTRWSSNDDFYENTVWISAGYPEDLDEGQHPYGGLSWVYDVVDVDHDGKAIKTQDDTQTGWSGGPLYGPALWTGDTVVGVLSGGRDSDTPGELDHDTFAGGKGMVNLVQYALNHWKRPTASVLFYNHVNGQWATGVLEGGDYYRHVFSSDPGSFGQWTHITGAGNGGLMFYNQSNGQWATGRLQPDASYDTISVGKPGDFAHWTHIANGPSEG
jgi:V8-like Glu-specific endopeptidase